MCIFLFLFYSIQHICILQEDVKAYVDSSSKDIDAVLKEKQELYGYVFYAVHAGISTHDECVPACYCLCPSVSPSLIDLSPSLLPPPPPLSLSLSLSASLCLSVSRPDTANTN
jgi:hypothetical protein